MRESRTRSRGSGRYTSELFDDDDVDRAAAEAGIGVLPSTLESAFAARVGETLAGRRSRGRRNPRSSWYGKQGRHSEHLGYLLAEMQSLHRAHPGATW